MSVYARILRHPRHGRAFRGRAGRAPPDRHQRPCGRPLPARADRVVRRAGRGGRRAGARDGRRRTVHGPARRPPRRARAGAAGGRERCRHHLASSCSGPAPARRPWCWSRSAVATGAMYPPSPSVLRARFPELLSSEPALVPAAYALDSVLLEITFVCAPLVVVAVIAALGAGRGAGRVRRHRAAGRAARSCGCCRPTARRPFTATTPGCWASCARRASARW